MSRKGMSAERIARGILEEKGFKILEVNPKIMVKGMKLGEIDLIVQNDSGTYAVEVKAGGQMLVRYVQIYATSKLLGYIPHAGMQGFCQ